MRVANSKNHKVFKVEDKGKVVTLNIGDSRKKVDGTWENFYWQALCVANAAQQARDIQVGDIIEIKEGIAFMETYKEKTYNKVTVFGLAITERAADREPEPAPAPEYEIPNYHEQPSDKDVPPVDYNPESGPF